MHIVSSQMWSTISMQWFSISNTARATWEFKCFLQKLVVRTMLRNLKKAKEEKWSTKSGGQKFCWNEVQCTNFVPYCWWDEAFETKLKSCEPCSLHTALEHACGAWMAVLGVIAWKSLALLAECRMLPLFRWTLSELSIATSRWFWSFILNYLRVSIVIPCYPHPQHP